MPRVHERWTSRLLWLAKRVEPYSLLFLGDCRRTRECGTGTSAARPSTPLGPRGSCSTIPGVGGAGVKERLIDRHAGITSPTSAGLTPAQKAGRPSA